MLLSGILQLMETDQAFWEQLRQVIREELAVALQLMAEQPTPAAAAPEWVSIKELCLQLKLSKQTLYNWQKDEKVNWLLVPCRKQFGGKVLYDLEGIKKAIKAYPGHFSGGRDYGFKEEAILTEEQKLEKRYKGIKALLLFRPQEVSKEDKHWYEKEDKRREREEAARFRRNF